MQVADMSSQKKKIQTELHKLKRNKVLNTLDRANIMGQCNPKELFGET